MRFRLAVLLLAVAAGLYWFGRESSPHPQPSAELDLTAAFQGPTAAADAATVASMCEETANTIEWDGAQPTPALATAHAIDVMRTRTREFLCKGESLGDRHPRMRQIVGEYLEAKLGVSGGAITPEQRAAWVSAYREVARAARHAIGH